MQSDENDRRLTANYYLSKKQIILNNFIGGIAWAVGTVVGASIVVGTIIWILHSINWLPGVGPVVDQVTENIKNAPFKK